MSHIFISYSRKDFDFAGKIVQALAENALDTWIDWKSIPKGEDWEQEIYRGIEEADAFLFLISPDSVASQMCNKEIAHAVKNGKRILPIVIRDADPLNIHPEISKRNWVFCRDGQDDFNKAIEETRKTIHTDYEWLKYHTELQVKALKWEQKQDASRLLRGKELREAEQQLTEISSQEDPQPTKIQREYILASQRNEIHTRRQITTGLVVGLGIMVLLSFVAWGQRNNAVNAQNTAVAEANAKATALIEAETQYRNVLARQFATYSQQIIDQKIPLPASGHGSAGSIDQAILLAVQSINTSPNIDGTRALMLSLELLPQGITVIDTRAPVQTLAYSKDKKYLFVVGSVGITNSENQAYSDTNVEVWKTSNWEMINNILISHFGGISSRPSVLFDSTGRWMFLSDFSSVALIDLHKRELVGTYPNKDFAGENFSEISSTGLVLFTNYDENYMKVSNLITGETDEINLTNPIINLKTDATHSLVTDFCPDSTCLAILDGYLNRTSIARIWDIEKKEEKYRIEIPSDSYYEMSVCPKSNCLVLDAYNSGSIMIWDVNSKRIVTLSTQESINSAFSVGVQDYLITNDNNGKTMKVWSLPAGDLATIIEQENYYGNSFESPDGEILASVNQGGTIGLWGLPSGNAISSLVYRYYVSNITFSINKKYVAATSSTLFPCCVNFGNETLLWDLSNGKNIIRIPHNGNATAVLISPDDQFLISGGTDGKVFVAPIKSHGIEFRTFHYSDSGGPTGSINWSSAQISSIAFSPDGKQIVASAQFGDAVVWDIEKGVEISRYKNTYLLSGLLYSPDGKLIASIETCPASGCAGLIEIWNPLTGRELLELWGQNDFNTAVGLFSPDGKYLALTDSKSVLAWKIPSGELVNITQEQFDQWLKNKNDNQVYYSNTNIVYSPDKKYSAIIKNQNIVALNDETLQTSFLEIPHTDVVSAVQFSSDGNLLATANAGVNVHIFFYKPSDFLKEACLRVTRNLTRAEWEQYIGDALPYQAVCPNLPIEPEVIITPTP